jgi:hypothetical protein
MHGNIDISRMDGKRQKGKMSKTKIIHMSIDRNVENESVLKYKSPSPSPSILHIHLHLSFLFSTFLFSTFFLSIFFLSAFFHHTIKSDPKLVFFSLKVMKDLNIEKQTLISIF